MRRPSQSLFSSAYASSVGSYSLQLHSYRILRPQLSAHHYSIKQFSEKLHVLQSAVIFKNLDTLRSCFSVQAPCFCIVFLDHVKYLQIHATSATSTLADWHTQKIHACSEVGCRPSTIRILQLYIEYSCKIWPQIVLLIIASDLLEFSCMCARRAQSACHQYMGTGMCILGQFSEFRIQNMHSTLY